ncbi:SUKH-3 domain-containing protein [Streptomyces gamaensis]|uniref:SUKH-3 domain-containing protein n=1 Tax=Streptomyces gamaensis TaxID=1763542 RepID=A0ABW0ZAC8_9ACTN
MSNWLVANSWFAGRDIGRRADELIDVRVRDSERQGAPMEPFPAAVRAVREYGLLRLVRSAASRPALVMKPTVGYEGDAAEIAELARCLGQRVFPVGYEESEYGLVIVDELGRYFQLHHTGEYFMGMDAHDMFSRFINAVAGPDVERFYASRGCP